MHTSREWPMRLLCENVSCRGFALGAGIPAAFEPMLALPCDAAGSVGCVR